MSTIIQNPKNKRNNASNRSPDSRGHFNHTKMQFNKELQSVDMSLVADPNGPILYQGCRYRYGRKQGSSVPGRVSLRGYANITNSGTTVPAIRAQFRGPTMSGPRMKLDRPKTLGLGLLNPDCYPHYHTYMTLGAENMRLEGTVQEVPSALQMVLGSNRLDAFLKLTNKFNATLHCDDWSQDSTTVQEEIKKMFPGHDMYKIVRDRIIRTNMGTYYEKAHNGWELHEAGTILPGMLPTMCSSCRWVNFVPDATHVKSAEEVVKRILQQLNHCVDAGLSDLPKVGFELQQVCGENTWVFKCIQSGNYTCVRDGEVLTTELGKMEDATEYVMGLFDNVLQELRSGAKQITDAYSAEGLERLHAAVQEEDYDLAKTIQLEYQIYADGDVLYDAFYEVDFDVAVLKGALQTYLRELNMVDMDILDVWLRGHSSRPLMPWSDWSCGVCGSDLEHSELLPSLTIEHLTELVHDSALYVLAGLVEQMAQMLCLDGADIKEHTSLNDKVMAHDLSVVKRVLGNIEYTRCELPNGVSDQLVAEVNLARPNSLVTIVGNVRTEMVNTKAIVAAAKSSLLGVGRGCEVIDCTGLGLTPRQSTQVTDDLTSTLLVLPNPTFLAEQLATTSKDTALYLMCPDISVLAQHGARTTMHDEMQLVRVDSTVHIIPSHSNTVFSLEHTYMHDIRNVDYIVSRGDVWAIWTVLSLGGWDIRRLSATEALPEQGEAQNTTLYQAPPSSRRFIQFPKFNHLSLLNLLAPIEYEMETLDLDIKFYRTLLTKYFTSPEMTLDEAVAYATMVSSAQTSRRVTIYAGRNLTPFEVMGHARVALSQARRERLRVEAAVGSGAGCQTWQRLLLAVVSTGYDSLRACKLPTALSKIQPVAKLLVEHLLTDRVLANTIDALGTLLDDLDRAQPATIYRSLELSRHGEGETGVSCRHNHTGCLHGGTLTCCCCSLPSDTNPCQCCRSSAGAHQCGHTCTEEHSVEGTDAYICVCCLELTTEANCACCNCPTTSAGASTAHDQPPVTPPDTVEAIGQAPEGPPQGTTSDGFRVVRRHLRRLKRTKPSSLTEKYRELIASGRDVVGEAGIVLGAAYTALTLYDKVPVPDERESASPWTTIIKFMPLGHQTVDTADVELLEYDTSPGIVEGKCGFEALAKACDNSVSQEELEELSPEKENLSATQILHLAEDAGLNLLLLCPTQSYLFNSGDNGSTYYTVVHGSLVGRPNHWCAASARVLTYKNLSVTPNQFTTDENRRSLVSHFNLGPYWELDPKQRLAIDLAIYKDTMTQMEAGECVTHMLRLENDAGQTYLTNNKDKTHDVRRGQVYMKVPSELQPVLSILGSTLHSQNTREWITTSTRTYPDATYALLGNTVLNYLCARLATKGQPNLISAHDYTIEKVTLHKLRNTQLYEVVGSNCTLKHVDGVGVQLFSTLDECTINLISGRPYVYLAGLTQTQAKATISVPKTSISSCIKAMVALLTCEVSADYLDNIMSRAIIHDEVFGSGKTNKIVGMLNPRTTVVAFNSSAVAEINDRAGGERAMSAEKASIRKVRTKRLIIDEAGLLDKYTLLTMLTRDVEELVLFGDRNQIGYKYLGYVKYPIERQSLLLEYSTGSTQLSQDRIGLPLCAELEKVVPGLSTHATHDTTFNLSSTQTFTARAVVELARKTACDTIAVYVDKYRRQLLRYCKEKNIREFEVIKVHAKQGITRDRVLVVQDLTGRSWGVQFNINYNITAATRCRLHLEWLVIGHISRGATLADLLALNPTGGAHTTGGYLSKILGYIASWFRLDTTSLKPLVEASLTPEQGTGQSSVKNWVLNGEDTGVPYNPAHLRTYLEGVADHASSQGASVTRQSTGEGDCLTIKALFMTVATIQVKEEQIAVKQYVRPMTPDNLMRMTVKALTQRDGSRVGSVFSTYKFENIMRQICNVLLRFKLLGHKMVLEKDISIAAYGGCNYCAGLKLYRGNTLLVDIQPRYSNPMWRTVRVYCSSEDPALHSLMGTLRVKTFTVGAGIILRDDRRKRYTLPNSVDVANDAFIIMDRLWTGAKHMVNKLTSKDPLGPCTCEHTTTHLEKTLDKYDELNQCKVNRGNLNIKHDPYVLLLSVGNETRLVTYQNNVFTTLNTWANPIDPARWLEVFILTQDAVKQTWKTRLMQKAAAVMSDTLKCGNIDTGVLNRLLHTPLAVHTELRTPVYDYLKKKVVNMRMLSLSSTPNLIPVPPQMFRACDVELRAAYPRGNYIVSTYLDQDDNAYQLLDTLGMKLMEEYSCDFDVMISRGYLWASLNSTGTPVVHPHTSLYHGKERAFAALMRSALDNAVRSLEHGEANTVDKDRSNYNKALRFRYLEYTETGPKSGRREHADVYLGTDAMSMDLEQIALLAGGKAAYFWQPGHVRGRLLDITDCGTHVDCAVLGEQRVVRQPKVRLEMLLSGVPVEMHGSYFKPLVVHTSAGFYLIKLERCDVDHLYTSPIVAHKHADLILCELPMIASSLVDFASSGELVKTSMEWVDKYLYNKCMTRLMRSECNLQDLLEYAQSHYNVHMFSSTKLWTRCNIMVRVANNTVIAAWLSHKQMLSNIGKLHTIGSKGAWSQFMTTTVNDLMTMLGSTVKLGLDTAGASFDEAAVISWLGKLWDNEEYSMLMNRLANSLRRLTLNLEQDTRKVLRWDRRLPTPHDLTHDMRPTAPHREAIRDLAHVAMRELAARLPFLNHIYDAMPAYRFLLDGTHCGGEVTQIPRLIHCIWHTGELPELEMMCLASVVRNNRTFRVKLWTPQDLVQLTLQPTFAISGPADRYKLVDYYRWAIVAEHGGVYLDVGMVMHAGLEELLQEVEQQGGNIAMAATRPFDSPGVQTVENGCIIATPGNPFVRAVADELNDLYTNYATNRAYYTAHPSSKRNLKTQLLDHLSTHLVFNRLTDTGLPAGFMLLDSFQLFYRMSVRTFWAPNLALSYYKQSERDHTKNLLCYKWLGLYRSTLKRDVCEPVEGSGLYNDISFYRMEQPNLRVNPLSNVMWCEPNVKGALIYCIGTNGDLAAAYSLCLNLARDGYYSDVVTHKGVKVPNSAFRKVVTIDFTAEELLALNSRNGLQDLISNMTKLTQMNSSLASATLGLNLAEYSLVFVQHHCMVGVMAKLLQRQLRVVMYSAMPITRDLNPYLDSRTLDVMVGQDTIMRSLRTTESRAVHTTCGVSRDRYSDMCERVLDEGLTVVTSEAALYGVQDKGSCLYIGFNPPPTAAMKHTGLLDEYKKATRAKRVFISLSSVPLEQAVGLITTLLMNIPRNVLVVAQHRGLPAYVEANEELRSLPNVIVVNVINHDKVIRNSSLVISSGSHGISHLARRWGVPMVIVPLVNDQYWSAQHQARADPRRCLVAASEDVMAAVQRGLMMERTAPQPQGPAVSVIQHLFDHGEGGALPLATVDTTVHYNVFDGCYYESDTVVATTRPGADGAATHTDEDHTTQGRDSTATSGPTGQSVGLEQSNTSPTPGSTPTSQQGTTVEEQSAQAPVVPPSGARTNIGHVPEDQQEPEVAGSEDARLPDGHGHIGDVRDEPVVSSPQQGEQSVEDTTLSGSASTTRHSGTTAVAVTTRNPEAGNGAASAPQTSHSPEPTHRPPPVTFGDWVVARAQTCNGPRSGMLMTYRVPFTPVGTWELSATLLATEQPIVRQPVELEAGDPACCVLESLKHTLGEDEEKRLKFDLIVDKLVEKTWMTVNNMQGLCLLLGMNLVVMCDGFTSMLRVSTTNLWCFVDAIARPSGGHVRPALVEAEELDRLFSSVREIQPTPGLERPESHIRLVFGTECYARGVKRIIDRHRGMPGMRTVRHSFAFEALIQGFYSGMITDELRSCASISHGALERLYRGEFGIEDDTLTVTHIYRVEGEREFGVMHTRRNLFDGLRLVVLVTLSGLYPAMAGNNSVGTTTIIAPSAVFNQFTGLVLDIGVTLWEPSLARRIETAEQTVSVLNEQTLAMYHARHPLSRPAVVGLLDAPDKPIVVGCMNHSKRTSRRDKAQVRMRRAHHDGEQQRRLLWLATPPDEATLDVLLNENGPRLRYIGGSYDVVVDTSNATALLTLALLNSYARVAGYTIDLISVCEIRLFGPVTAEIIRLHGEVHTFLSNHLTFDEQLSEYRMAQEPLSQGMHRWSPTIFEGHVVPSLGSLAAVTRVCEELLGLEGGDFVECAKLDFYNMPPMDDVVRAITHGHSQTSDGVVLPHGPILLRKGVVGGGDRTRRLSPAPEQIDAVRVNSILTVHKAKTGGGSGEALIEAIRKYERQSSRKTTGKYAREAEAIRTENFNELTLEDMSEPLRVDRPSNDNWYALTKNQVQTPYSDPKNVAGDNVNYACRRLWQWGDQTDVKTLQHPLNDYKFTLTRQPSQIKEVVKYSMCEWPEMGFYVMSQMYGANFNAVTTRQGKAKPIRTVRPDKQTALNEFVRAWFHDGSPGMIEQFQQHPIAVSAQGVLDWLAERSDAEAITNELHQLLSSDLALNPVNDVKIFNKLEALLKAEVPETVDEMKVRSISWQSYAYAAVTSQVFKQAKARLKELLEPRVRYADGMTPSDLARFVGAHKTDGRDIRFFENDMSDYDSTQDSHCIDLEFEVYKLLGVSDRVLSFWRTIHRNWTFKGNEIRGRLDAMRLTGQTTTSLGNTINNLMIHRRLKLRNQGLIEHVMVLGDDILMTTRAFIDTRKFKEECANESNVVSKPMFHEHVGSFCSMLVGSDEDGRVTVTPDLKRLRRRFETPSGASVLTPLNVVMRSLSYMVVLGPYPTLSEFLEANGIDLRLTSWYDAATAVKLTSLKYDENMHAIEADLKSLLESIVNMRVYEHKFKITV